VAAGLETLRQLRQPGVYPQLEACASALVIGLREAADEAGVELSAGSLGGLFGFFFHPGPVHSFEDAKKANGPRFRVFFTAMLERGVYLAPSPFEAGFVSLAHRPADIAKTIVAARAAFRLAAQVR
ncbi:MAG TPA: aspartate aminotransferase family protein, partial [Myxococcota bacterium]|nr:aspartate aminotransferase family protein [Myxococcota bacterium]